MEVTNGLLSSLVQTKSIERVLAPIASQVSLLIILDESDNGVGKPDHMGPCAQAVMKAAENLIKIGKERANNSPDQDYQRQMMSACEILDLASSGLYIASQRLDDDASKEIRTKVINASKDVLQGTMKVLLVSDDAEVRKVVSAGHLVTECLSRLSMVHSMQDLLANFKSFTDGAALLCSLAQRRQAELCQNRQRERIITALSLLKKSIPSLSVALQSYIKYPKNQQAQMSKSFVINQAQSAVSDIVEAVENKFTDEDYLDVEEPGYFVTKIDQVLEALSVEKRFELDDDLETWTENLVRHSMLVAHLCLDHYRNIIVKTCQRVLQLKSRVLQLNNSMISNPELPAIREDYEECCENYIDEFCELEKDVNLALLNLVVDVFKETTEPLERLVKAAMYSTQEKGFEKHMKDLVTDFQAHADKMGQIASFAAASSTDAKRVRTIRRCVCHLERLDPDIVPAVVAMAKKSQDKMAVRHVKLLMKEWTFELTSLMQVLDEMTDPRIFMQVSESRIQEDISVCHGYLEDGDEFNLGSAVKSVVGRARRVCQMAERIIGGHKDPLYRNGLLVFVKQLQKVHCSDSDCEILSSNDEEEEDEEIEEEDVLGGRRIVELSVLAAKLEAGCKNCSAELKLSSCIGEIRYGLGSLLKISCSQCQETNNIPTGKRHGTNVWDINTKLGAAALFCGQGEMIINNFLAALNIPTVTPVTFKRREREVGSSFEAVANETCNEALNEEKQRSQDADDNAVSFDAGWQTRGSGRNYASLTGHASMIGQKTGKVLSYAVRCKKCRICDQTSTTGTSLEKDHDCRKNWTKSSKAMESDMAIEMLHDLKTRDFHVKNLIMDNDSTTLAKAKLSFDPNIQKISDFNHTKKNLASKLYDMKKEKKYPLLGPKSIQHLLKCFTYAVKSNNDTSVLKKNLEIIPSHVFGDHKECDMKWCKYLQDPENYKPKHLPYGKYLTGEDFRNDLQHVFSDLAKNATKLSNLGSTQANENFNRIVACKNPKNLFYGGSESTSFRVAAAVAHKNIGNQTIEKVYDTLLLSPGLHTNVHKDRVSKRREKEKERKSSVRYKRRRHELKQIKSSQISVSEIKEGTTYAPGVSLCSTEKVEEEIPDCKSAPVPSSVSSQSGSSFVYFDLETTGFAVNGLRAANSNLVSDRGNRAFADTFQKRLEQVLDRVQQVTSGLSEDNHPSILSPQRKNLRQTAMSHSNIYKKSSKSSLLSSKASLQDHSTTADHPDKSSRSSLHDQSSRSGLHNRSSRTTVGFPSLHLSSTEDTDVFLDNSVENPIQKSRYSSQHSSHQMSSSNDRQHKVFQHFSETENLGGMSIARKISEGLTCAVQKINKHRSNLLCGELLAWTNHIVDMAKHIGPYCLGTKQKSIRSLCHETDLLASEIIDQTKSVLAGDADQMDELNEHCLNWKTKAEKLQICVDATVDTYKVVPDALIEALSEQNLVLAKEELDCLKTHYSCVGDVVLMTQGLVCTNQAPLRHCQDFAEELENITITITTTAEMSSQRLSDEDINQLDQLGREWAVMMFCILSDLDTIVEEVSKMGIERKVWSTQDMTSLEQEDIIAHVEQENKRLRDILHGACIGNESKAKAAQDLCHCMSELLDKLRSEMARRVTSCQRAFMVSKSYVPLRIRMASMCWIVKAVCCVNMIQEQISVYFKPVMSLTDRGVGARTMPEGKQRMIQISELQLEISRFSEKLVKMRQRVQSCIQLSTNLEKRAAVRRCLDQVTESSPRLIQVIKSLTDDEHTVTETMVEVDRQKLLWASQIRELMVNLRQMSDIKPNLVAELHNLMGVLDMTEKLSADSETETLAGNHRPSGSLEGGKSGSSQIQPMKFGLPSVHEELLLVTREKDLETNVGTFSRNRRKDHSKSPYKPSASILDAARFLQKEADKWEDENNPIVQVAKEMSLQMEQMAEFCKGDGPVGNHQDVVRVALAIADNGRKMKQFTDVLAKHCIDERCGKDLQYYSSQIPSLSKQLTILANVQMGSQDDNRADRILVQNARNLMTVVLKAMTAAEAVCVKGLFSPDSGDNDEVCAVILATQWRRRLHHYRKMEAKEAIIDELGLRRTEEHRPPKLTQIFQ